MSLGNSIFRRPSGSSTFLPRGLHPQYSHPFEDMASLAMPQSIKDALRWSQFIALMTGPYRSALHRIVAYCITDPEIKERPGSQDTVGKEVKQNYEKIFSDDYLRIKKEALDVGMDLLTYGNAFVSVFNEFTRYLSCRGRKVDGSPCGAQFLLKKMIEDKAFFKFNFTNFEYKATCPYCHSHGTWKIYDMPSKSTEKIFIHRWNPLEMDILYDPFSKQSDVVWNIPSDYAAEVERGDDHIIATVPLEILEAVKTSKKFKFNKEHILHLKADSLAGLDLKGWGLPSTLSNFRQAWMYQVCTRHTESTAMESLAPLRILSPAGNAGNPQDPIFKAGPSRIQQELRKAVDVKRRDPSAWLVSPIPVQYQVVGGDAQQFIPRDLLEYTLDNLLTSTGIPVEMYKGSMSMQAAPVALRLFTSYWQSLVTDFNRFIRYVAKRVSDILGWEPVDVNFMKITYADDINRQNQAIQLLGSGAISQTTALASIGFDKREEARKLIEEQQDDAELQARMQKELETNKALSDMAGGGTLSALNQIQQAQQAQAQGGAPPMGGGMPPMGGGAPPMGGGMPPMGGGGDLSPLMPGQDPISQMIAQSGIQPTDSIQDIYAKAQTLAQQFMSAGNTSSALRKLKQQDPQLHTIVKGIISDMRSNAASQGRDMVLQQQMGGG